MFQRSLIEAQFPESKCVSGFISFLEIQPMLPEPGCVVVSENPPAGAYLARSHHGGASYIFGAYLPNRSLCKPELWVIKNDQGEIIEAHGGYKLSIAIASVATDNVELQLTCEDQSTGRTYTEQRTILIPKTVPRRPAAYLATR